MAYNSKLHCNLLLPQPWKRLSFSVCDILNVTNPSPIDMSVNPWSVFEATPGKRVVFLPNAPQFTIIAASNDMCHFLRLPKEQFVGKSVFDAFPDNPADPEASGVKNLLASLQHVLQFKTEHRMERQRYDVAIDGGAFTKIYWQNNSVPVLDENGEISCIVHTAEDITEQVKAENRQEKIKGIEKAYHLFMKAPMVIGIAKGDDYVLELANGEALKLWGRTADIIGKPLLQSIPELKNQGVLELFDAVRKTGRAYKAKELPVISMAGGIAQIYYYDVIYEPYYEEGSGGPVGVFTVSYDVTEQVATRKKLEEKEQSLALAVEIGELGVFHIDLKTDTGHYSPRIREWFGLGEPPLRMEEILSKVHPDDQSVVAETLALSIAGEWDGRHDFVYRVFDPPTGAVKHLRSIGQVQYEGKAPVSISGIIQDETERAFARQKIEEVVKERTRELAQANEALRHANKELHRSNQNLEEFAHAASHDLKEPVRKIHFFTHQLKTQLNDSLKEAEIRSFNRIENATERMGNLIDDLLLYSHVSQRPHETETIDLNEKAKRVLEDLELDIQEKRAVIDVEELPAVNGYRRQLQQLLQNLLSNALKYSKAGVPPHINIRAERTEIEGKAFHVLQVQDNGIGFEQQHEEKIFQMFARLHGKSEYSGTGVGLSIVKKVVENHNGFIRVESVPGEGSTFHIYLPV